MKALIVLLGVLGFIFALVLITGGLHEIKEGHVGVYWRGGALLSGVTSPGYHTMLPGVTSYANVQITLQTDTVVDIPCGTATGVMIYFDKVEVVNRLAENYVHNTVKRFGIDYDRTWIFDKIHHEINQFCSSHTLQEVYIDEFDTLDEALASALQADCDKWETGIEIIAIRVTKPRIPMAVKENYDNVEKESTDLRVATAHQAVVQKEMETLKFSATNAAAKDASVAIMKAKEQAQVEVIAEERERDVSKIRVQKEINEWVAEDKKANIDNEILKAKFLAKGEALFEKTMAEAEADKARLTPEYLKLLLFRSIGNISKTHYGNSIVDIFTPWLQEDKKSDVLL